MVFGSGRDRSPLAGKENALAASDAHGLSSQPEGSTRTRSFSFLGRSKSSDRLKPADSLKSRNSSSNDKPSAQSVTPRRSFSGKNKLVKKHVQREIEEVLKQAQEDIPAVPPVIPSLASPPELQTFGGEGTQRTDNRTASMAINAGTRTGSGSGNVKNSIDFSPSPHSIPMPPVPGSSPSNDGVDAYARTESMTNRGRYSYASSFVSQVNGPRRVRRRKDPTPFK